MPWQQNIKHWTGIGTKGELIHTARDRKKWSEVIPHTPQTLMDSSGRRRSRYKISSPAGTRKFAKVLLRRDFLSYFR